MNSENAKPALLLVNDLHIDKDNVVEFEKNWNEMLNVCIKFGIKRILLGGDVFTNRNAQTLAPCLTVRKCLNRVHEEGMEIHIAPGNHDKVDTTQPESWCDLYADYPSVHVVDTFGIFNLGQCYLAMFAYYPEESAEFKRIIDECKSVLTEEYGADIDNCIAYVHAGIHGALGDFDVPSEAPQDYFTDFKATLCGHYHNRTRIKNTDIYYIGSSRPHTFGEDEEKGYTLMYPDGSFKFVKNQTNIRFVTDELTFKDLNGWTNTYGDRYKVRLKIKCTSAEAEVTDKQDLLDRGANKIEFVTEKIQAIELENSDFEEKFNNIDLQQEYQDWCGEQGIDCNLGVEYLNKTK